MLKRLASRYYRVFLRWAYQGVDPALDKRAVSLVLEARRHSAAGLHEEALRLAYKAIDHLCPLLRRLVPPEGSLTGPGHELPLTERSLRLRVALEQGIQVLEVGLRGTTHPDEALKIVREATELLRVWSSHNYRLFLPVSAEGLLSLSFTLHAMGRPEEALDLRRKAINLLRKSPQRGPVPFGPLMQLDRWDLLLRELGRHEEALVVARAVIGFMRRRVERDEHSLSSPGGAAGLMNEIALLNLAGRLGRLGKRLSELGQHDEALNSTRESVGLLLALKAARPSRVLPELLPSLERLGRLLREAELLEEALRIEHEAAGLRGQDGQ